MKHIFSAADILLPDFTQTDVQKWSVIACDQYTGDPDYWEMTAAFVGDAPSTLALTLPEIYLGQADVTARIGAIHKNMRDYMRAGIYRT